jgi:hypothetical protein
MSCQGGTTAMPLVTDTSAIPMHGRDTQQENDMPSRNHDDQNPPSNTVPEEDQEDLTATEPDEASTLSRVPSPDVTVNPRIKNN